MPPWDDDRFIDESHVVGGYDGTDAAEWAPEIGELHEVALNELEGLTVHSRMLVADTYRVTAELLREAESSPEPWVGPDATLDPAWVDPRDRSVAAVRRERREFAVRAAASDIAVRLHMSESAVYARAFDAGTLRARCPRVWGGFLAGAICEANARAAASGARDLPDEAPAVWQAFDEKVAESAARLTPEKFRTRVRVVRERVHPQSIDERHEVARRECDVWLHPGLDGLSTIISVLPAVDAQAGYTRVDHMARHLHAQEGETRTLAQLRAAVMADLLAAGVGDAGKPGKPGKPGKVVAAITVPVLTLLGHSDEPATLEGYGPIDLDTAKRLAGEASSWVRILTHPVTGTVLDLDRQTYRVPKALRRWLGVQNPTCVFPGCPRSARDCEIDHRLDWQYGGRTSSTNLAPACKSHHRVRHKTKWELHRHPKTDYTWWVSPSGRATEVDPPPF